MKKNILQTAFLIMLSSLAGIMSGLTYVKYFYPSNAFLYYDNQMQMGAYENLLEKSKNLNVPWEILKADDWKYLLFISSVLAIGIFSKLKDDFAVGNNINEIRQFSIIFLILGSFPIWSFIFNGAKNENFINFTLIILALILYYLIIFIMVIKNYISFRWLFLVFIFGFTGYIAIDIFTALDTTKIIRVYEFKILVCSIFNLVAIYFLFQLPSKKNSLI